MKHFAILGYPLGHTQSPQLHQRLAAQRGWEIQYDICQIPPEEFDQKIGELFLLDGFNVTIPYKVRIIDLLDELAGKGYDQYLLRLSAAIESQDF